MYRVLSLDGGGVRGLLSTRLLEKIELSLPGVLSRFDLIAGTSTGAIPALGLAAGMTPSALSEVYQEQCSLVFADSILDDIRDLLVVRGAEYATEGLKQILQELFGDKTLGDLPKRVLVPAVQLDNNPTDPHAPRHWKSKFFHNYPGPGTDADQGVVDVALRSTAAPVFFPMYQGYIDGGLVANNPSMCALVQVLRQEGIALEEVVLFSVGTGRNPKFIPELEGDWGLAQWAYRPASSESPSLKLPLVELIFEASIGLADYQCRQLLGPAYHRLDPWLGDPVNLDDDSQISHLNQLAGRQDLGGTIAWLERYALGN